MTTGSAPSANPPSYPKNGTYADLLWWHLYIWGTREGGNTIQPGKKWSPKQFSGRILPDHSADHAASNLKNWLGRASPPQPQPVIDRIEEALFGDTADLQRWKTDLRLAHERSRGKGNNKRTIEFSEPLPVVMHIGSVPRPTAHFLGRDDDVEALAQALVSSDTPPTILIQDGPGIGKVFPHHDMVTEGSSRPGPGFDLTDYRNAILRRAGQLDWWSQPISLVVRATEGMRDARQYVSEWCTSDLARHLVIVGEAGAGKSGLVIWAECELQRREDTVTLLIPAARLRSAQKIDLPFLFGAAQPPLAPQDAIGITASHKLVLLLDGLDELAGADLGGDSAASVALADLATCLPAGARVIATCRKVAYARIDRLLRDTLPDNVTEYDDLHQSIIGKVIGTADPLEVIEIGAVRREEAIAFLAPATDSATLEALEADRRWDPFLELPILLLLLKSVLPSLVEAGTPALDKIYALYVRHALLRNIPGIRESGIAETLAGLRRFSNIVKRQANERDIAAGLRAGLLKQEQTYIDWSHYTFWEYFFATLIYEEIIVLSSDTIARVDLINGYNINRILVPMLNRAIHGKVSPTVKHVRLVQSSEYRTFLSTSGWRQRSGYGLHPSIVRSRDGIASASFIFNEKHLEFYNKKVHGEGAHSVACQLSWYDATAFAYHASVRIPTSHELRSAAPGGNFLYWCSDWQNESIAHMCAYDGATGNVVGLNPDIRLARTALAVVD